MERELLSKEEFMTFEEAYAVVDRYMDFYNNWRKHSRLKRMSPISFTKWVSELAIVPSSMSPCRRRSKALHVKPWHQQ
ncbi:IS3 family transposase [Paenibacillus cisolokensis]|uniref:IS3 family transposase n=1 Tax=Paenibacillus cisolokensis TaxID=1658519 RepID=UPI001BCCA931